MVSTEANATNNAETALLKVDIEGGNLTFDLGASDNDTLTLSADSSIDLAGGTMTIANGDTIILTASQAHLFNESGSNFAISTSGVAAVTSGGDL